MGTHPWKSYLVAILAPLGAAVSVVGCSSGGGSSGGPTYPIDSTVVTTTSRVLRFPVPVQPSGPGSTTGLHETELHEIARYGDFDPPYGAWTFSADGLPVVPRTDLMPAHYLPGSLPRLQKLASFFAITDIHVTDEEAPNQFIYLQQEDATFSGGNTSIYSPVMLLTTQVLDAAVQTVNALHAQAPFDFGLSLGDAANSTSWNELRWYIDVLDGKWITPSSGAHLGADTVDFQKPFQAAGLDRSIPFYQALGNHDHFQIGSFPVYADPSLGLAEAYVAGTVWATPDVLVPYPPNYPRVANMDDLRNPAPPIPAAFYSQGVIDGSSPTGAIVAAGPVGWFDAPPAVAADPGRRSLQKAEWIAEFFDTTSTPVGHGFALVDLDQPEGFACYSFVPVPGAPLKVIVLDDTQSETDGSKDIHGHGYLDANRWAWLQRELDAGQAANQLMVIAAHIPIGVAAVASGMEWWDSAADPDVGPEAQNAVSLPDLVAKLQATPNFLVWLAGHRHVNVVKAFPPADPADRESAPWKGFWQVETSSLRDFPQQFRTFEIVLNADYTVSIVTTDVDPAVRTGTPAATSRAYSVAVQQIVQNDMLPNNVNQGMINQAPFNVPPLYYPPAWTPIPTMDPSRVQMPEGCYAPVPPAALNCIQSAYQDPSIQVGGVPGVPYLVSYNAELLKQLSPAMVAYLRTRYPTPR
ncbi:MAG: TIGR03768 family metallophosphoesterase [Anaeromyxobacteraceae bacterium]